MRENCPLSWSGSRCLHEEAKGPVDLSLFALRPSKRRLRNSGSVAHGIIGQPADLHVIAKRINHMQAELPAIAHLLDAHRDQIRLDALAVEIRDRVGHMVDDAGRLWPLNSGGAD